MKTPRFRPFGPMAVACAVLLAALPIFAAETADDARPRVGLVLGGGGARGAAHVGVIRVLEEQHVKVDYIAGTSMGAIVGALYALGLTADEIEQELLAVDWGELFEDRPERRDRSMRRKDDDTETFFAIEFGLRGGWLAMPRGLIVGQKLPFAFNEPGLVMAGHRSFDELPIPYRAVATDLQSGEMVVLDRGNLIRAVRASMSVPGIFPPVELDDRMLVDGYVTSNVPVDAVLSMGADIVIAVEVGRRVEDVTPAELETMGGIQEQTSRIQSQRAVAVELSRADLVIRPQLEEWSGKEYDQLARIIPRGEAAAREQLAALELYAVPAVDYEAWRARVTAHSYSIPVIDRLELENETRIDDAVVRDRLAFPLGKDFDPDAVRAGFEDVFELGLVERTDFDLDWRPDGEVLTVYVYEKPYAPYLVYLGGSYRLNETGISPVTLNLRVNKLEVNRRGAEWRTDASVGSVLGIRTEFYQPVDFERRWFAAPYALATAREDGLFYENRNIGEYRLRHLVAGLDLGRTVGRTFELRAGVFGGEMTTRGATGLLALIPERNDFVAGPRAQLKVDTLDDHRVPHRGVLVGVHLTSPQDWLGADIAYDRLWGQMLGAKQLGNDTVILDVQGGTDFGSAMPYYEQFYLGGLRSLSGYHVRRLRGSAFGLASVGWLHRLGGSDLPFAAKTYLGLWADAGNVWDDSRDAGFGDLIYNAAVSLLIETPLGPLHFGYGHSDDGNDAFHLDFGVHLATPAN